MELNREADDEHLKTLEKAVKNKFRWHWLETTVLYFKTVCIYIHVLLLCCFLYKSLVMF
jgi:hypothetical protein